MKSLDTRPPKTLFGHVFRKNPISNFRFTSQGAVGIEYLDMHFGNTGILFHDTGAHENFAPVRVHG